MVVKFVSLWFIFIKLFRIKFKLLILYLIKNAHITLFIPLLRKVNAPSRGISKMWAVFFVLSILPEIPTILVLFNKIDIWTKFSGNIDRTKKADHILEMPQLEEFCSYCFKNHTHRAGGQISVIGTEVFENVSVNERQKPLIFKTLTKRISSFWKQKLTAKNINGTEFFLNG